MARGQLPTSQPIQRLFDQRAGALLYVAKTTCATWCLLCIIFVVILLSGAGGDAASSDDALASVLAVLVVAPLLENILLAGIIEFLLIFTTSAIRIALINAVLFGVLHYLVTPLRSLAGFLGFGVMSYSYLLWYDSRFGKRYAITVAQHALNNGLTYALALALRFVDQLD